LYSELSSDILINGRVVKGFKILRGVKQGDSLSCVLFIMCIEPLLRNIDLNNEIEPLHSEKLGAELPKVYGYADDINSLCKNKRTCIQALFDEYSRLTKWSGLRLNAEKTEILRFGSNRIRALNRGDQRYEFSYMGIDYALTGVENIKITGILFQQNEERMRRANLEAIMSKINKQLLRWSRRGLSLLGKIVIMKTFGISQITFLMQSIYLETSDLQSINKLLYKFLWNKNYRAAKAPERIKREIINKPIELGGFGMLDIFELDNSLKLRVFGEDAKH